jgi:hypothetical protein
MKHKLASTRLFLALLLIKKKKSHLLEEENDFSVSHPYAVSKSVFAVVRTVASGAIGSGAFGTDAVAVVDSDVAL